MNKRLWSRLSLAIAGGGTLAVTAVAAPALGWVDWDSPPTSPPISPPASAQLTIINHGELLANGTAAKVTATLTCGPGSPTSRDLWIDLAQPRRGEIAFGFGHVPQFVCDGTPHRTDVVVRAEGRPFRRGESVAVGRLEVSFAGGFQQRATAAQIVKLSAGRAG